MVMKYYVKPMVSHKVLINPTLCGECGACVAVCPPAAIELFPMLLVVKDELCTECSLCVHMCPAGALAMAASKPNRKA